MFSFFTHEKNSYKPALSDGRLRNLVLLASLVHICVKVTVQQSYSDWTRVLTDIQTQNEAGAQPGASNLSRLVCGKINFATATKNRKSEKKKKEKEKAFFYFIALKPQDPAFLKHWESSGFMLWPTALKGFFSQEREL